jgi:hypothetical protein
MGSFLVDSYKVRVEVSRGGSPVVTSRVRLLELRSAMEFHGIVEQANLVFATNWDSWSGSPVAGYYSTFNPLQPVLSAWLPSAEYPLFYDIVRSEKPVTLSYQELHGAPYETPSGFYVSEVALGTSTEPVGEGPADLSP